MTSTPPATDGLPSGLAGTVRLEVTQDPDDLASARRRLDEALSDRGADGFGRQDAALVLGELLANAVDHGRPFAEGRYVAAWGFDDEGLVVAVTDAGSSSQPVIRPLDPDADRGRGMRLVDAVCLSWSVDRTPGHHTTVVAHLAAGVRPVQPS